LFQIKERPGRLRSVPTMDWTHLVKLVAIAAGALSALLLLILGTLAWLLNHPAD
jgi:hypothetical protein